MSNCRAKGLPNFLHYRTGLRYLDLSHNNLGGQNPSWLLQNNTRLQQFLMEGNSFKGHLQLPKHVNVNMFQVDISGNKMRGQIPMNIGSMFPHLQILNLSRNVFEGILEELAKSGSLLTLRLSSNNLSGKIPPTMFTLDKLRQLYLDGNNFDGEMPLIDISTLSFPALSDIDLSDNHLSVELPKWIWNVPNFEALDFSNNNFYGHFPLEFCNLGLLRFLDLSQNNFSGSVPSCISSLAIEHLHLSRNRLSGPLPLALYISSLVALDLGQNNLTGKIPYWVANLSALRILVLRENHFKGEIPSQICQLNLLSIVDLSQNKLSGHIPSCLSTLTLMPTDKSFRTASTSYLLDASQDSQFVFPGSSYRYPGSYVEEQVLFTTKKGSYSYSGNLLEYMSGIDLSCNMLTGPIPPELGNMSELHSLNLSHNNLIGFIPSWFSKLEQIESSIPYDKAQFATFDESSYLGNPFLCGPPKHENCSGTGLAPTAPNASSIEEESGFMDKHAFLVTFLASYPIVLTTIGVVLYINPYCNEDGFISSSSASTLATISLWSMFSEEAPSPMPWWFPLFLIV
ncbi:receptor-like protein 15 [Gossypium hirsutum]|uniref:Receptor-like protein 15 n=1 Tax=Gossypium hirsutum TaxID=3635 RepID=A0A1U8PY69_GOSHI|nr:receptor-like protein 15 [Gossypium hirsutum]